MWEEEGVVIQMIRDLYNLWRLKRLKKLQESYHAIWDAKSNHVVLDAYVDAREWIRLHRDFLDCETGVSQTAQMRLDEYIIPQMKKRGLYAE